MKNEKKTMYEILEVSPDASDSEIQAAHQRLSQQLQSERSDGDSDDIEFKLRVLNVAFNTLSVKRTRDAYDARLAALNAPAGGAAPHGLIPVEPKENASSLKAEAMSLKAEAMSLKAEAVSLRADVIALRIDSGYETPSVGVLQKFSRLLAPAKRALTIVGSLIAIGMVVQVLFLLLVNRQAVNVVNDVSKAEEKVMLQDYYQRTGVRVSSRAEMEARELEDAARQREELAKRVQQEQELNKQREYENFVEDSRRQGEEVAADLQRAEERARYEEEQARLEQERRQEEEERNQKEAERQRVQDELNRWRRPYESYGGNHYSNNGNYDD